MSGRLACIAFAFAVMAAEVDREDKYPKSQMLIDAAELAKPDVLKRFRALDTRSLKQYKEGSIFHASWVDVPSWNKAFTAGHDKATWADLIRKVGVDADIPVVVYGDDLRETARIWWILRYWGIRDVRILNGGWKAWKQAAGQVTTDGSEPIIGPNKPVLTPLPDRLAVKDQILEALRDKSFQIADARSDKEFCGEAKTARRNGSIPGAKHLEWSDLIDRKTERLKTPSELKKLLRKVGIDIEKPTVTYCQSGGRAAVLAFALELMGGKDVRNYYRSWAEWGNDEKTPIANPKK